MRIAKKKRDHQLARSFYDQNAFMRALHHVEGYAEVRASEEELARLGEDPDAFHRLFAEVNDFAASLAPCVHNAQHWQDTDAQTLCLLVCGGDAVRVGARTCAPPFQELPSFTHQFGLYLILLHSRAVALGLDPEPWVRCATLLLVLGPRAMKETARRCDEHVGMYYGVAGYIWQKPEAEEELRALLNTLPKLSWGHLSPRDRRAICDHEKARATNRETVLPEIVSAFSQTLNRGNLLVDPLNCLLQALNGKLNFFPEAVANQVAKDLAPLRRYRTIEVDITSFLPPQPTPPVWSTCGDRDTPIPSLDALPALDQLSPIEELMQQEELGERERLLARINMEVASLCAQSAKHRVGYEAVTHTQSKVELAAQHRRNPDTITRWEQKFLSALRARLLRSSS
jgi:hypothetical protein